MRKYTVLEIERMRHSVEHVWLYGYKRKDTPPGGRGSSRPYKEDEKVKCVEEILRTYMLASISPEELE